MAAILTIVFELALPGLLWLVWREAERADQEVETLHRSRQAQVPAQAGETRVW
jgi:hypothetical protein